MYTGADPLPSTCPQTQWRIRVCFRHLASPNILTIHIHKYWQSQRVVPGELLKQMQKMEDAASIRYVAGACNKQCQRSASLAKSP